jgi:anaphase-promoting complex subunit 7
LQAGKFYESAIHLEPGFLRAARALADHHVAEGRYIYNGVLILLGRSLRQWAINSADGAVDVVFFFENTVDVVSVYSQCLLL